MIVEFLDLLSTIDDKEGALRFMRDHITTVTVTVLLVLETQTGTPLQMEGGEMIMETSQTLISRQRTLQICKFLIVHSSPLDLLFPFSFTHHPHSAILPCK
jgi:hypothetical protein